MWWEWSALLGRGGAHQHGVEIATAADFNLLGYFQIALLWAQARHYVV